jgi:DNA-binding transcriptional regulator YiaG
VIVYALVDPRDQRIRYVGKTHRTAQRRLRRHLAPCYLTGDTHKERWIRVLLAAGMEPTIVVLERCGSAEELVASERRHIARLRYEGAALTNGTDGGDGMGGWQHSDESKEKIRRALLGKPKSETHRRRSALSRRGLKASVETRTKLSEMRRGKAPAAAVLAAHPRKLSDEHVVEIRSLRGLVSQQSLADRYGVSKTAIRYVQQGRNLAHVGSDLQVRQFPEVRA